MTETRRDYHIQVDVRNVGGDNLQQRMIESWAMAFGAVGIPFLIQAARMQTLRPEKGSEYHQLIYGVTGYGCPHAAKIREAMRESLCVHDFTTAQVDVTIYLVHREIVSSDCDAKIPLPRSLIMAA